MLAPGTAARMQVSRSRFLMRPVIGVTVSRTSAAQRPKVQGLVDQTSELLDLEPRSAMRVDLWDAYCAPRYG
nr:hypothetical protein [Paraburkholderia mimosarum]